MQSVSNGFDILKIAAAAPADPRTVRKYLRTPDEVMPMVASRIKRAMGELGYVGPVKARSDRNRQRVA